MSVGRPGAELLVTPLAWERRGRPGAARAAALRAAEDHPADAGLHLLDAVYASLVAGEPRAACRLLDRAESGNDDPLLRRRARACRAWAAALDRNWYPGDVGAEIDRTLIDQGIATKVSAGDAETVALEAWVTWGVTSLLSHRALIDGLAVTSPDAARQMLAISVNSLQQLGRVLQEVGAVTSVAWVELAVADLLWRIAEHDGAAQALGTARARLETVGTADRVALAGTYLFEGDCLATSRGSPETFGLALAGSSQPRSGEEVRGDTGLAAAAYDHAQSLLAEEDAPRLIGAIALRQGVLAWQRGDVDGQFEALDAAEHAFDHAGDAAAQRLATAHRLTAAIAAGDVAATRRAAAAGWDLVPRGPVAELLNWATTDGSVSYCAGIGRMFHRLGEHWEPASQERAAAAYLMAVPLVAANGALARAEPLGELARVDARRGLGVRAATRFHQAFGDLPDVVDARAQPLEWMRALEAVLSVLGSYVGAPRIGAALDGMERAAARVRGLLAVPGAPPRPVGARLDDQVIAELASARHADTLERLLSDADKEITEPEEQMLTVTAAAAWNMLDTADIARALSLARSAEAVGARTTAEQWYASAVQLADATPGQGWMAVLALASQGRTDEAIVRLASLADELALDQRAALALRAGDARLARRLFEQSDGAADPHLELGWRELADRAEAALHSGDPVGARSLAARAQELAEQEIGRLSRDADRVAACDDHILAGLYMTAAGASRALARNGQDRDRHLADGFALTERARGLALLTLMRDLAETDVEGRLARRWQQAATAWQAAHDMLHSAYATRRSDAEVAARIGELAAQERALADIEAEVERRAPGALVQARRLSPSVGLAEVQAALPEEALLVEYQLVGRDLQVWAATRSSVEGHVQRLDPGQLPALVRSVRDACRLGAPAPDADALADILLAPIAGPLDACRRVIIVPSGVLNALPFAVLPLDGGLLGTTRVLSHLPAASLLSARSVDAPVLSSATAIIGDPAFDADAHPGLPRLPGAATEARAVAAVYGEQMPLIGPAAVEREVVRRLARASLVHIAAHGHLDPVAPGASAIVLAGRDELTVSDLIGVHLPAELAVLSACDSGRGAVSLGGDVVGLARGLLAAGAHRCIVSLWPVDDVAACVTMASFHDRLHAQAPPACALAAAQDDLRRASRPSLAERYCALGGSADGTASATRRGAVRAAERGLPWDPDFEDVLDDPPLDTLDPALPRLWAPFILIGA